MKHKPSTIGLLLIVLLAALFFFVDPVRVSREEVRPASEQSFSPEALAIRDKLYAKTTEYGAKTKRQIELQKEIDQLESEKAVLREAASGYDKVLCAEHRLQYVRPNASSGSGTLMEDCDFQSGTPGAL